MIITFLKNYRTYQKYFIPCVIGMLAIISLPVFAIVPIQSFTTPQHIQVLLVQDPSTPLISVNFSFQGAGSAADVKGKEGIAQLMTHLLLERSTEGSDHYTLEKKLKTLGVLQGFQYNVDADNITFRFKCPTDKLQEVFNIVKTIIVSPDIDAQELAKVKNFDFAEARLSTAGEREFAGKILIQKLLSPHPYSVPISGINESRQSITIEEIRQAIQHRFARQNLVFSVVGNIQKESLVSIIDSVFGALPHKAVLPTIDPAVIKPDNSETVIAKDTSHCGVVFGQPSLSILNKDYIPLTILNDILGGKPFTSRLWLEAREKSGHVYSIQTDLLNWKHGELMIGAFESDNSTAQNVMALIRREWKNLHDNGITEAEFKAAKAGLQGSFVLHFTSPDGIADYILNSYLAGLPADFINQRNQLLETVTLQDVNRVAKTQLNPEKLMFVVVGNPKKN